MVGQRWTVISKKKFFLEQILKNFFEKFFSFALKSTPRKFQDDTLTVEKLFIPPPWTLKWISLVEKPEIKF